jgi:hypothetical protein
MEYFKFDYANVKKEFGFSNYEKFIFNNKDYKYYMFDLGLLRYDMEVSEGIREKAKKIINCQKIMVALPYIVITGFIGYYHKRNYFKAKMYTREHRLFLNLFIFICAFRILQKGFLKYQSDETLFNVQKEKSEKIQKMTINKI